MRIFILYIFTIICLPALSQKIFEDKTDPFTGERSITTNIMNVVVVSKIPVVRAALIRIMKKDTADRFNLSLIMPDVGGSLTTADSIRPFCEIKLLDNSIVAGSYQGVFQVPMPVSGESYIGVSYLFSTASAEIIRNNTVTAIRFAKGPRTGINTFEVKGKEQNTIPKLFDLVLKK